MMSSASNKLAGHIITSLLITENTVCIQDNLRPVFAARHEEAPQHGIMMNAYSLMSMSALNSPAFVFVLVCFFGAVCHVKDENHAIIPH